MEYAEICFVASDPFSRDFSTGKSMVYLHMRTCNPSFSFRARSFIAEYGVLLVICIVSIPERDEHQQSCNVFQLNVSIDICLINALPSIVNIYSLLTIELAKYQLSDRGNELQSFNFVKHHN